jgi:hypothetical protein
MTAEINIPSAKDSYKESRESEHALNNLVHSIAIGIKETAAEGRYEYTHYNAMPPTFCSRITKVFKDKGYEVRFNDAKERNVSGITEEFKVFLRWDFSTISNQS